MSNFRLADSTSNVKFDRNMIDGYQMLSDSVLIQDTPINQDGRPRLRGDRAGVYIHQEGPLHLKNVAFKNYKDSHMSYYASMQNYWKSKLAIQKMMKIVAANPSK